MLFVSDLTIIFNISLFRSILGFLFLTIFPGILMLQILKLDRLETVEKIVLSVGLSVSFIMLFGLLINNLALSIGYLTPLSITPLLISYNIAFIILIFIAYKLDKGSIISLSILKLNNSEKAFLIIPTFFPAISIFGIIQMNTVNNNVIVILLLFLIPIYIILICIFNFRLSKRIYPAMIFLISCSLLLLMALRSNHLIGIDTHKEYYLFKTTLNELHWGIFENSTLDSTLSISLLPAIYQLILNIPPELLFKILYSLIYSISPLIIYVISKKYIEDIYAFLASCFYMFQYNFLFTAMNARTSLAVFFFALAIMTLFNSRINPLKKRVLFIIFMISIVISHYSTTYIFFFILFAAFILLTILSNYYKIEGLFGLNIIVLLLAIIFFWYSQITKTAFNAGINFIIQTIDNLNMLFLEEVKGGGVPILLGEGIMEKSIVQKIEFLFNWLIFAVIAIGIITLIIRYKEMSFPEFGFKSLNFQREKFEVEYFVIALLCSGILVIMIALPYVSKGYDIQRLYSAMIIVLSIFFVIGGLILSKYLNVRAYFIILLILIPYFFIVTGITYQIIDYPRSIILNSEGEDYNNMYLHDQEYFGAKWLGERSDGKTIINTDFFGRLGLISQGSFSTKLLDWNSLSNHKKIDGYIYLRYYNIINSKIVNREKDSDIYTSYNLTDYINVFSGKKKIYNNGGTEIYGR